MQADAQIPDTFVLHPDNTMQEPLTFFLIDDDKDDQEIFAILMEEVFPNAQCVFSDDGIQALDRIGKDHSFTPSMIFIDINMPRMNGLQCLMEIRKIARMQSVPVYMYSTSAEPSIVEQSKSVGADGFIKKLSDLRQLKKEFETVVKLHVAGV